MTCGELIFLYSWSIHAHFNIAGECTCYFFHYFFWNQYKWINRWFNGAINKIQVISYPYRCIYPFISSSISKKVKAEACKQRVLEKSILCRLWNLCTFYDSLDTLGPGNPSFHTHHSFPLWSSISFMHIRYLFKEKWIWQAMIFYGTDAIMLLHHQVSSIEYALVLFAWNPSMANAFLFAIAFGAKCNVNVIQNTSKMGRITSKSNSKFRGQVQNVNCITLSSWFA